MLILLPPSESKTPPTSGAPVAPQSLSFPELTGARDEVLAALECVSSREDALSVLGVGESLTADVARNRALRSAPTGPALSVYSGVLYDALDLPSLGGAARDVAERSLLVISALWGAVRPTDRIPAYRLAMATALPGHGKLATWWKPRLAPVLDEYASDEVVVDCRSAPYAAAWKAPAARTVSVRVEQEREDGTRSVVSHHAKHTRGLVARRLCEHEATHGPVRGIEAVRDALAECWRVELSEPAARKAATLTAVLEPAAARAV